MNKLFISTYNEIILIALINNNKIIQELKKETYKNHSEYIVPMIQEILLSNDLTTKDLNEIIVVNGPGSFTGTRLGVTDAKMLAYTLNIPIKTISSIEAIAFSHEEENKIIEIPDSKGKYLGIFENNKLINEIIYLKNEEATEYIKQYNYPIFTNNDIKLNKIIDKLEQIEYTEVHNVNPIYIKKIEALNDK